MSSSSSAMPIRNSSNRIYCHCNMQCAVYTSHKSHSEGRKFYRCSRNRSEDDCNFFRWCDEVNDLPYDSDLRCAEELAKISLSHILSLRDEILKIKKLLVIILSLVVAIAMKNLFSSCICNC
ncbi:hypothetical protein MA16_Dca006769 [Dendrobium catenatum]|uniref:GRF-type domain-containing protein n=1 Tax=Dendrobium catenatum TaxID=906689 RepID=A0A2I0W931_9ASPA|nr:hypothetical protein MA16_Dca006769 [Dendrobium catenatum]